MYKRPFKSRNLHEVWEQERLLPLFLLNNGRSYKIHRKNLNQIESELHRKGKREVKKIDKMRHTHQGFKEKSKAFEQEGIL